MSDVACHLELFGNDNIIGEDLNARGLGVLT
jgi:hypothetical protein